MSEDATITKIREARDQAIAEAADPNRTAWERFGLNNFAQGLQHAIDLILGARTFKVTFKDPAGFTWTCRLRAKSSSDMRCQIEAWWDRSKHLQGSNSLNIEEIRAD